MKSHSLSRTNPSQSVMRWIGCLMVMCGLLSSCGTMKKWFTPKPKKTEEKVEVQKGPRLVGRIAAIPPERKFVLIRGYGKWTIEAGQVLTTRGPEERTANLRTTGEMLGEFAAADIQSGTVENGDAVYFTPPVATPETPETPANKAPEPAKPAATEASGNVQKNN